MAFLLILLILLIQPHLSKTELVEVIEVPVLDDFYVSAGEDQILVYPHSPLKLSAMASIGLKDAQFQWKQVAGKKTKIDDPHKLETTVTGLTAGVYTFRVTRIDIEEPVFDEIQITVLRPKALALSQSLGP